MRRGPWAAVDARFLDDIERAGLSATDQIALVRILVECAAGLSDGVFMRSRITPAQVRRWIAAGVVAEVQGGLAIVGFLDFQASRVERERDREATAARMRRLRLNRAMCDGHCDAVTDAVSDRAREE
jgi:hypothetical protein